VLREALRRHALPSVAPVRCDRDSDGRVPLAEGLDPDFPAQKTGPPLSDSERDRLFESLPDRQKGLLRLVADGLSDAEIARQVEEPEPAVGQEIQVIFTELGLKTRTHAIVYILAREISATTKDHTPRALRPEK
jgi:DNA-binding NarL/FixJ family response regulator